MPQSAIFASIYLCRQTEEVEPMVRLPCHRNFIGFFNTPSTDSGQPAGTKVQGAYVIALVSASALVALTKTLTLGIPFQPLQRGISYCTCVFLVKKDFNPGVVNHPVITYAHLSQVDRVA